MAGGRLGRDAAPFAGKVGGAAAAGGAVQRNPATVPGASFGGAFDRSSPAGRAHERFAVAVCRDQRQGFGSPVLLDPATSHGSPFRQAETMPDGGKFRGRRGPAQRTVRRFGAAAAAAVVLLAGAGTLRAQAMHEIRLEGDTLTGVFRFVPSQVRARAGDTLRFVVRTGGPYAIGFRAGDLTPSAHAGLNAAIPDRLGDLRGPVLSHPGEQFRITLPALPAGTYEFFCLAHLAYAMTGRLTILGRSSRP